MDFKIDWNSRLALNLDDEDANAFYPVVSFEECSNGSILMRVLAYGEIGSADWVLGDDGLRVKIVTDQSEWDALIQEHNAKEFQLQ